MPRGTRPPARVCRCWFDMGLSHFLLPILPPSVEIRSECGLQLSIFWIHTLFVRLKDQVVHVSMTKSCGIFLQNICASHFSPSPPMTVQTKPPQAFAWFTAGACLLTGLSVSTLSFLLPQPPGRSFKNVNQIMGLTCSKPPVESHLLK